jgi:hypothetical protein
VSEGLYEEAFIIYKKYEDKKAAIMVRKRALLLREKSPTSPIMRAMRPQMSAT